MPINDRLEERLTGVPGGTPPPRTGIARTPVPARTGLRRTSPTNYAPFNPSQFQRGVGRGVFGLEESAAGAVAAGAAAVGADDLRQSAEALAARRAEAGQATPQPRVSQIADIKSPGDLADWAMQGLGQLTPFALTTPTGAGVGAGVGAGALRLAGQTAIRQGVRRAAIGGAATSTITPEIGGQYTEQRGAGVSPEMAAAASIPGGIAAGAIDVIPQIRAARAVLNPGTRSVRRAIGEDFVTEAGTEGIQEGIAVGSRAAVDPNFEVFTPENAARVGEALALGGLGGAVRGAGTAAGAAINRRAQNTAETRANIDARVAALRERLRGTPADQVDPSMVLTPEDAVAQLDALRERVRSGELTPEDASKEAQTISDMVYGGGETIEDDGAPSSDAFAVQNEDDGRVGGRAGTDDSEYFSTQVQPQGNAEYLFNRSGRAYQATAANQYLNEGRDFESNALEKELSKLREKEDGYVYRPVSMREVLSAEIRQQSESPDTQNAYLAQMGERKFNEVKDSNPRWADLYDPADPAAFLDNFHVIERKQAPPAVRPGDDLGLSAEDITPPMTPADKRRAGALRAQSKAGDLRAKDELAMLELKYENRRILRPPPKDKQVRSLREVAATTTDGKRVNINAMGLTAAMLNRVQSDEKLTKGAAPSADRIARAFTAGLSSLTEHGIDVGKLNIPDNTIVFSARTPGGGLRNYTYGEIRKSGRARLEQQVKDAEADVRRAEGALRRIPEGAEPARVTKAKRDLKNATTRLDAARGTLASTPLTKTEKATRTLIRGPKRKAQAEAAGNRGLAQYIEERMAAAREFLKAARQRAVLGPDARLVGLEERRARMARRLEAAKAKGDKTAIAELNEAIERADSDIADARKQRADREVEEQRVTKVGTGEVVDLGGGKKAVSYGYEGSLETDAWSMEDALKELKAMRRQDFDYDAYSLPTLQKIASLRRLVEDALGLPMATLRERFTTAMGRKPTAAEDTPSAMLKALQARLGALMENKDGEGRIDPALPSGAARLKALNDLLSLTDPVHERELQKRINEIARAFGISQRIRLIRVTEASEVSPEHVFSGGFSTRKKDEFLVYINPSMRQKGEGLEAALLAHEMGHIIQLSLFDALPAAEQKAVLEEYTRWLGAFDRDTMPLRRLMESAYARDIFAQMTEGPALGELPPNVREYHLSFNEWFADQTGRWLLGETKPKEAPKTPKGPVEKFFAAVAEALRKLVGLVKKSDPEWGGSVFTLLEGMTRRANTAEGRIDLMAGISSRAAEFLRGLDTPERTARLQKQLDAWGKAFKLPHKVRLLSVAEALELYPNTAVSASGFSVRRNGELLIYVSPATSGAFETATLAHEFGHTLQKSIFDALPASEQAAVLDEFAKWVAAFDKDSTTLGELMKSMKPSAAYERLTDGGEAELTVGGIPPEQRKYATSFNEWFADQTSRWLLGETKPPKGPVERFFARVAEALLRLVGLVNVESKEWGGSVFSLLEGMTGVGSGWASSESPLEVLRAKNLTLSAAIQKELRKIFPQRPDLDPADVAWLSVLNGNQTHTAAFRLALNELAPALFSKARHAKLLKLTDGDIGAAFQQWSFGEKQTGDLGAELERLHNQLERVFETLVDQPVMDTLWQGQAELREHLTSLPPGSARLNAAGTARAAGFWGKAWNKVGGAAASLFVASDARLRATKIPAIIAVARHFQVRPGEAAAETYPEAKTRHIGNFVNRARRIFDGQDKAFGAAVLEVLQNPNTLANAPEDVKVAAKRTWALMREMRDYMLEAGVELGDRGDQYFPWVFDTEYLQQHRAEFIAWIGQGKFADGRKVETSTGTRTLTPEEIYDRLVGNTGLADVPIPPSNDPHAANFRSLNKRVLAFIETMGDESDRATLARFLSKDFGQVLGLYIDRAVKQAEYVRRFGAENEKLNEMLAEAKGQGATPEQIELAETMVMAHVGLHGGETAMRLAKLLRINPPQYGRPIDPRLQRVQSWAMVYQNLRVLSLATITSLADVIGIGVRTGDFAIAFEGFRQGLVTSMSQHKEELSELAQALGIVDYTLTNEALGWEYGGMYLTGKAKRVNEWFFRAIGLQAWTRTTRVMALSAGRSFLVKHATNPNRNSARFLEELSLTPADILVSNGSLKVLSRAERKAATPEEVARDDRVRQALIRFVDGAILRPNASQRPLWMSDPHFALVGHLKGFMYAFHETILRRVAHEAKNGNLVPLMALSAFIPAMIAGDVLRDLIRHGGIPNFKQNWTALDYIQGALHRSGILGAYGTMGLDVAKDYNYGGVSVLGPTIDQLVNPDLSEVIPGQNVFKYWIRGGLPDASAASATGA